MASQSMEIMAKALEHQVLQSARMVEEQVDAELNKLERMDDDDLEKLKERRLEALKKAQKQKQVRRDEGWTRGVKLQAALQYISQNAVCFRGSTLWNCHNNGFGD